jgi:hypothetical protein
MSCLRRGKSIKPSLPSSSVSFRASPADTSITSPNSARCPANMAGRYSACRPVSSASLTVILAGSRFTGRRSRPRAPWAAMPPAVNRPANRPASRPVSPPASPLPNLPVRRLASRPVSPPAPQQARRPARPQATGTFRKYSKNEPVAGFPYKKYLGAEIRVPLCYWEFLQFRKSEITL